MLSQLGTLVTTEKYFSCSQCFIHDSFILHQSVFYKALQVLYSFRFKVLPIAEDAVIKRNR